jgi:hypothetical protein
VTDEKANKPARVERARTSSSTVAISPRHEFNEDEVDTEPVPSARPAFRPALRPAGTPLASHRSVPLPPTMPPAEPPPLPLPGRGPGLSSSSSSSSSSSTPALDALVAEGRLTADAAIGDSRSSERPTPFGVLLDPPIAPISPPPRTVDLVAPLDAPPNLVVPAGPIAPLDGRPFKLAAALLAAVSIIAVVVPWPKAPRDSLPLITLPIDAAQCRRLESEGTSLICVAEPASLHALAPAERARRLALTTDRARAAGFTRIVFREGPERVWRVEELTLRPPTTTGRTEAAAPSSTSPSGR